MDEHSSNILTVLLCAVALSCLVLLYLIFTKDNPISGYRPRVKIQEANLELRLAVNGPYSFEGRVYDNMTMSDVFHQLGIQFGVITLTQPDYDTYKTRFGEGKPCPGPFLSSHASPLLLIPVDASMRQGVKRLVLKRGDHIRLSGLNTGILSGKSGPYSIGAMESDSEMNIILVTSLEVNGARFWGRTPVSEDGVQIGMGS